MFTWPRNISYLERSLTVLTKFKEYVRPFCSYFSCIFIDGMFKCIFMYNVFLTPSQFFLFFLQKLGKQCVFIIWIVIYIIERNKIQLRKLFLKISNSISCGMIASQFKVGLKTTTYPSYCRLIMYSKLLYSKGNI